MQKPDEWPTITVESRGHQHLSKAIWYLGTDLNLYEVGATSISVFPTHNQTGALQLYQLHLVRAANSAAY
jgi:hypothetical protein